MKKKMMLLLSSFLLVSSLLTANAFAGKAKFSFFLSMSSNDGAVYSDAEIKEDYDNYGAATTHNNDLVDTDRVYYRISNYGFWGSSANTSYYRVYGNGTINMTYWDGGVYNKKYILEGDTDVNNAYVSGIWEP